MDHVVPHLYRIREGPEGHPVFLQAGHPKEIGDVPQSYNKLVVVDLSAARPETRADRHDAVLKIDLFYIPHHEVRFRAKTPDRGDGVGQSDATRNDFR